MTYTTFIETTGANIEKDVKWAWGKFKNKEYSLIKPALIHSPIEWNYGTCFECDYPVAKTATGCPQCHISFID